jgi:TIR domain
MSIFVCYSHKDKIWHDRLMVHLKPLETKFGINSFSDRQIRIDEDWRDRIKAEIQKARIAVLLVSADFLASDFVTKFELPKIFEQRAGGKITVVTIFVAACAIEFHKEVSNYQAANAPSRPLNSLSSSKREEIFVSVINTIIHHFPPSDPRSENDVKIIDDLPEVDYLDFNNKKMFDSVRVSIPKLIAQKGHDELEGLSFQRCFLVGPTLIYSFPISLNSCTFRTDPDDPGAMLYRPVSKASIVGAVIMNHLSLFQCVTQNIGFVAPNEHFIAEMLKSEKEIR